jgi:hypothetical protein
VAPAGVNFYNSGNPLTNSTGNTYAVYVIVPTYITSGGVKTTTSCSSGNGVIQANSTASFPANLNIGFFTPCDMTFQNGISSMTGQLYAGQTLTKGGNSMTITGAGMNIVLNLETQAANPAGYS